MTEFQIEDLTCSHCASTIANAVHSLDQAAKIEIDIAAKRVRVDSPLGPAKLAAAIRNAGFTPASG
jgi:copper chaperone